MMRKITQKWIVLSFIGFLLIGCSQYKYRYSTKQPRHVINVSDTQKRLNLIDCRDTNDWYLDGNRVAKSFAYQKQTQLAYRMNFCQRQLSNTALSLALQQWQAGYDAGINSYSYVDEDAYDSSDEYVDDEYSEDYE